MTEHSSFYDNPEMILDESTLKILELPPRTAIEHQGYLLDDILMLPEDARNRVMGAYTEFMTTHAMTFSSNHGFYFYKFQIAALETCLIWEVG